MRPIYSPWNGHIVGEAPISTLADAEAALARAHAALPLTSRLPAHARHAILSHIVRRLSEEKESLAQLVCAEAGKPIRDARTEVERATLTFSLAADETRRIGGEVVPLDLNAASEGRFGLTRRFPAGVVAGITPFNFPLNLVAHKLAPAIAAGCPLLLKPAEKTPLVALKLAQIVAETDWPEGALSVLTPSVPQEIGEILATDSRVAVLSFTGSDAVGWHLKSLGPKKRHVLELGGSAAGIVCQGADLEWAATRCVLGAFAFSGQVCISLQRLFVEENVFAEFCERLVEKIEALTLGDPADEKTDLGPMITEAAARRVDERIEAALSQGATARVRGERMGNLLGPSLLTNTDASMVVEAEEIFGPVLCVRPFSRFDEALRMVNESRYGLQAGIFTRDIGQALTAYETLAVGGVIVNDAPGYRVDNMPYGGVKESGQGREGLSRAIAELTDERLLVLKR
jgi:acyl-CoA reductase-like NAD-dependent aldehyde dehydrogenase